MRQVEAIERAPMLALRHFARDRGLDENVADAIYEQEWMRLSEHARVKRFVPLLAEKHVKAVLRMAKLQP